MSVVCFPYSPSNATAHAQVVVDAPVGEHCRLVRITVKPKKRQRERKQQQQRACDDAELYPYIVLFMDSKKTTTNGCGWKLRANIYDAGRVYSGSAHGASCAQHLRIASDDEPAFFFDVPFAQMLPLDWSDTAPLVTMQATLFFWNTQSNREELITALTARVQAQATNRPAHTNYTGIIAQQVLGLISRCLLKAPEGTGCASCGSPTEQSPGPCYCFHVIHKTPEPKKKGVLEPGLQENALMAPVKNTRGTLGVLTSSLNFPNKRLVL
jgi:hypothetical protein